MKKTKQKNKSKTPKKRGNKKGAKITPSAQIKIKQIDFESLCKIQATGDEIACFFGVSRDTVDTWCKKTYGKKFSEVFRQYRQSGKVSLRRKQFQVALRGNPKLLVWLGKQYLEQKDKKEITGEDGAPIAPSVVNFISVPAKDKK